MFVPEWVCTQVLKLCFLPAFVEKNQTTISRNHCPSCTSPFGNCDKWEFARVFQVRKVRRSFSNRWLCSASSTYFYLKCLAVYVTLDYFGGFSSSLVVSLGVCPTPLVVSHSVLARRGLALCRGGPQLPLELWALLREHLESSPATWFNTCLIRC